MLIVLCMLAVLGAAADEGVREISKPEPDFVVLIGWAFLCFLVGYVGPALLGS